MNKLKEKLPGLKEIAPVYATAVVILYAWSLMRFFWRIPSFLMSLPAGRIAVVFAYLMSLDFLESLILVSAPIALSLILPKTWFRDQFVAKGSLLVALGLWYLNYVYEIVSPTAPLPRALNRAPLVVLGILTASLILGQIAFVRKILEDLTDRLVVFLYLSIPVSALSLLTVALRNIF